MNSVKEKIYTLVSIILVLVLTFMVYYQLFNHDFLVIDDSVYVTNNQHVRTGLNYQNIYWAFTSFKAEFWHPVTWISYMLDTQIYGVIPGGYLLTNLLLHLINVFLVFLFFKVSTNRLWESLLIAALFGVHPLHVETVAWIAERKEVLCGFFWLLTTVSYYYYTKYPDWKRYCLIIVFFVLGIMSKTMIVTLPFALLLLDYWPLKRTADIKRLIIEKIPLFLFSLAGCAVTLFAQNKGNGLVTLKDYSLVDRLSNCVVSYLFYLKKTIWPVNLSVFYPVKEITPLIAVLSTIFLIGLTIIALVVLKREKFVLTGWLWFLGTLVPVIGIVKIGDFAMADRYMYIPIIGLFIIIAFGFNKLILKASHVITWQIILFIILISCYIPNTYYQISTWKNNKTLLGQSLKVDPKNFFVHFILGKFSASTGDNNQAISHFAQAIKSNPGKPALWIKLGQSLYAQGSIVKAISSFEKARSLVNYHIVPHFYLLCSYIESNKMEQAQQQLAWMFENNNKFKFQKDENYLLFRQYFDNHNFKKADIYFIKVLEQIGIINPQYTIRTFIIRGYDFWKALYLKKADNENINSNIN